MSCYVNIQFTPVLHLTPMSTNIHWFQFKIQSHFECWYIRTHTDEKPSKISNITFAILQFIHRKKTLTKWPSWVLWSLLLLIKPSDAFQMIYSNTKNAKSKVRQPQVCYLRSTHSSALKHIWLIAFHIFPSSVCHVLIFCVHHMLVISWSKALSYTYT